MGKHQNLHISAGLLCGQQSKFSLSYWRLLLLWILLLFLSSDYSTFYGSVFPRKIIFQESDLNGYIITLWFIRQVPPNFIYTFVLS